jgi:glycosyltransferase involved in cell wall biosynthesis
MSNDHVVQIRPAAPRIAVISHSHPSISKGGAEIAAYTLYNGLRKLGCDAIFIAACPDEARAKAFRASEHEYLIFTRGEMFEHFYQLGAQNVGAEIEQILRARRIQLVNFHHFNNFGLGALRRIRALPDLRMVFTIHEFLALCLNHGQMITSAGQRLCEAPSLDACVSCFPSRSRNEFFHRSRLFHDVLSSFDQLIAPSHFLAERFCAWGLDEEKMFIVENGLANLPEPAQDAGARRRREWTFGFFGQINPFKGVDVLLDAAELLKRERVANVRIRIHGNLIGQTEQFCNRFRDACASGAVEYFGAYDNRNVARLMADCDYVVVPSRWWENSPVVIQEAFGVGRPVLCSGVGGMAEKVRNSISGLHFRIGDSADLAHCIIEAASPETHRKLVKGLPRPFDGVEMARRYLEVFSGEAKKTEAPALTQEDEIQSITFG